MQNFYAFKLNKINEVVETEKDYAISFSIDSLVTDYYNSQVKLILNKSDSSLSVSYDKKLNQYFKDFINKSIQDYRYIKFEEIDFFGKEVNTSNVKYNMLDKEFNAVINYEYINELNPIEIPYSNGHKLSSYLDTVFLNQVLKQYFVESNALLVETNKSIALISLSMYLESVVQNRIINTFLYAQSLYLLNIMSVENGLNIFEKVIKDYSLNVNNKVVELNIKTQLDQSSLLNLEIIASINDKKFFLTDTNHNLNIDNVRNLLSEIYEEEINFVKTKKNDLSLREIKNEFVIINNVEKKYSGFVYEPLNTLLTECKGFVFDIQKMEIEEIFSISELNNLVFEKIKCILI